MDTGIPEPCRPNAWLVPPWEPGAHFSDVVRHFVRYFPWTGATTAHQLIYFEGYQAALANALPDEPSPYPSHQRWVDDMRDCVNRCVTLFREKLAAEIEQAKENVRTMQALNQITRRLPPPRIKAS